MKKYAQLFIIVLSLMVGLGALFLVNQKKLLTVHQLDWCLHESFDPQDYINDAFNQNEVHIEGQVDQDQIGEYSLTYKYHHKKEVLKVVVKDLIKPIFDVVEKEIIEGERLEAIDFCENIQDDSKTEAFFKKEPNWTLIGEQTVRVYVRDELGNEDCKETLLKIEQKDTQPPLLYGLDPIEILQGQNIDLYASVIIEDDLDPNPTFTIDNSSLNTSIPGKYEVYYHVQDKQGNSAIYTREINVKAIPQSDDRVIYLTIDDGPSKNTPAVLDILNRYGVKATFFVTGANPEYYSYINQAYKQGHVIGMHTFCHDYGRIYSSDEAYLADLKQITDLVEQQTGNRPHYFRFPGGSSNTISKKYNQGIMQRLVDTTTREGMIYYDWNASIGDGIAGMKANDLIQMAKESGQGIKKIVMLMHDGSGSDESVKALPTIIEYYQNLGYNFKTIDDYSPTAHHRVAN